MRTYSYTINGARYDVTIESLRDQVAKLNVNGVAFDVEILGAPLSEGDLPEVAAAAAPAAPDTVVVLEAMKMENNITAECDGTVTGICVAAGDSVLEGTTLLTIG